MSMPNGVPQSPTWLSLITKCPACISLATFGEEYSTTTVWGMAASASPSLGSLSICEAWAAIQSSRRVKLMKPGPLTSGSAHMSVTCSRAVSSLATCRGGRQRRVGLEIGERGGPDQRVRVAVLRAERRDDGVVHPLRENLLWIGHDLSLSAAPNPPPQSNWRRRKWPPRPADRPGPNRWVIFSVISPRARSAASRQAEVTARAVLAPCAITTVPPRPSRTAPP